MEPYGPCTRTIFNKTNIKSSAYFCQKNPLKFLKCDSWIDHRQSNIPFIWNTTTDYDKYGIKFLIFLRLKINQTTEASNKTSQTMHRLTVRLYDLLAI